jgi:hypothetical protein
MPSSVYIIIESNRLLMPVMAPMPSVWKVERSGLIAHGYYTLWAALVRLMRRL